jgi:hypothetical protein
MSVILVLIILDQTEKRRFGKKVPPAPDIRTIKLLNENHFYFFAWKIGTLS